MHNIMFLQVFHLHMTSIAFLMNSIRMDIGSFDKLYLQDNCHLGKIINTTCLKDIDNMLIDN